MSQDLLATAYADILATQALFTIKDASGIPVTENAEGEQTMPFWSSQDKAQSFIDHMPQYQGFEVLTIEWPVFAEKWLAGLEGDKLLAGLDWQAPDGKGFDLEPHELYEAVEALGDA